MHSTSRLCPRPCTASREAPTPKGEPRARCSSRPCPPRVPPLTAGLVPAQRTAGPGERTPSTGRRPGVLSRWFGDRGVNAKVLLAVGSVAAVAATVGGVAITQLASVDSSASEVYAQGAVPVGLIGDLRQETLRTRLSVVNHAVSTDPAGKAGYQAQLAKDDENVAAAVAAYAPLASRDDLVEEFQTVWAQYQRVRDDVLLPLSVEGDLAGFATARDEQSKPLTDKATAVLTELQDGDIAAAKTRADAAHDVYTSSRTLVLVLLVVGLALGTGLALYVARLIVRPLRQVNECSAPSRRVT